MKYKYYFSTIISSKFAINLLHACDFRDIVHAGENYEISFTTDTEPTKENIEKIVQLLSKSEQEESMDAYFANIKFKRAEVIMEEE